LSGKLGIYGRSLGGISSSELCGRADMVIVDRTFSSFEKMAKNRYFYNIAAYLFKLGTFGWQVKVDQSYCKSNE
jgi:hypothetical protein